MKKFLLTAALILAVVTSLTAGTLAAYNQTLSVTGDVTAKKFSITAAGDKELTEGIKLVPGQSQWYTVTVSNDSEMDVALLAKATISGAAGTTLKDVLQVGVYDSNKNSLWQSTSDAKTLGTTGGNKTYTFAVKVTWPLNNTPEGNAADLARSTQKAQLTVKVNGSYTENDRNGTGNTSFENVTGSQTF